MVLESCNCGGLPAHDHYVPGASFGMTWDANEIGRVWVDWRAVARALMAEEVPA